MFRDAWVRWGFGSEMHAFSETLPFIVDYRAAHPDERHRTPLEIAVEVARTIYDTMPKPISLMVSGGIDSQVMAYAFRHSGVPYRCFFASYNGGLNAHDFQTSVFYRQNDVPVEVIDVDIMGFHTDKLRDWCVRYENNSPHFLSHLYVASHLPGTVVSSGCLVRQPNIGQMSYSAFGFERYSRISGQPVLGYFLNYDPRLLHALARIPLDDPAEVLASSRAYERKAETYQRAGFPVRKQPVKLHGFERIKEKFDESEVTSNLRIKYRGRVSNRPYDLMFRYPLMDLYRYSDQAVTAFWQDK